MLFRTRHVYRRIRTSANVRLLKNQTRRVSTPGLGYVMQCRCLAAEVDLQTRDSFLLCCRDDSLYQETCKSDLIR